jgi:hypothetical protein
MDKLLVTVQSFWKNESKNGESIDGSTDDQVAGF